MQEDWATELEQAGYTLVETHISRVFMREHDVYKTKRAVSLGFLDFTTLEARALACEAEIELNRRMAADVYLGVMALIRGADGKLVFAPQDAVGASPVLEWAVHMRRLADDDRADVRLARGQLGVADVRRIAETLARFHAEARSDATTARYGCPDVIARNVEENFSQVRVRIDAYVRADDVESLLRSQRRFLETQRTKLELRVQKGFSRDGHGDLRLEHLYLTAWGRYIAIDCIEFNERFRFGDVCADLAFLTMDLTVHGRSDLAELLAAYYAEEAGDYGLYAVFDFYQSYRALVRAKVGMLLAGDPEVTPNARARGAAEVRRHFMVALSSARLRREPARLLVMFGLIASGKSTLSSLLRERLHVPVVSTDRVRKQLLGIAPTSARHDAVFEGGYSSQMTRHVYDRVFEMAEQVLCSGRSIVIDASFRARADRARAVELAERHGVEVFFFECWCPRAVTADRLARRVAAPSVSDGRLEIYDAFAKSYEEPADLPSQQYLRLDTTRPPEQNLDEAMKRLT